MKNITVIGTGYVGLVAGTCLADFGHQVRCVDIDQTKIDLLNSGKIPIYEPGLEELIKRNKESKRLSFSTDIEDAVRSSEVVFIGVGTPSDGKGEVDMSYVYSVVETIAKNHNGYTVVVTKSTVPPGTAKLIQEKLASLGCSDKNFDIVSNPEFLREGSAIGDFMIPDRIVIGANSEKAFKVMREVYRPLFLRETPIVETNPETAELIKYASNGFLATKISFINEISLICDKIGADIYTVSKAMGLDGRISSKFLHAGPGYGGSCFPKDTEGLYSIAKKVGVKSLMVKATMETNERQKITMVEKFRKLMKNDINGKRIAILGLTFKPKTDDIRETPALVILRELLNDGADISAFDPEGIPNMKQEYPEIEYSLSIEETLTNADGAILITEWNELRTLNPDQVKGWMKTPVMLDCRNIYNPSKWRNAGFEFDNVGKLK
ncbi:MAG: UDP-glucose/GDP-mannose dehydrogenase family protein [Candidatus Marinimicrobia bacterium]|nr:UDP-glucose/GDP-mannose dehydrogenase family protein [Candidatus Neomarinimicrobiota bacterium]MBL7023115.1 UDP-glucose/GDP-mannose dehydrogenase family protein [Candidatus Neomarinimicrobiota bacterium]MBL7110160.1 UDP-glucose/GDP-mannose dehydrogenase family protein [Candidatus Neomarinimicrobiota bacterium]